jgi:hypothetical protein
MQIHFSEQDVVDACCVYVGSRHRHRPEDVQVDLQYNQGEGFAADAKAGWTNIHLNEQDMIDAVATYLAEYHNFQPDRLTIDLQFPEESRIEAYIVVS